MITLLTVLAAAASEPSSRDCPYDYDRNVELTRDAIAFDQKEGQGWRPLYDAKCYIEAAELLHDWQRLHAHELDPNEPRDRQLLNILIWHEAQMWAFGERHDLAVPIFERAYRTGEDVSSKTWNLYADGTLAFLRRDREALKGAKKELALVPKPEGWDRAVDQHGNPISLPWPQNLDVLEGLLRCWDEPYDVAYLCRDISKLQQ